MTSKKDNTHSIAKLPDQTAHHDRVTRDFTEDLGRLRIFSVLSETIR